MGNSAKFMLVGILVVVLLIAMIWDRSNEQAAETTEKEQYPLENSFTNSVGTQTTGTADGCTGDEPGVTPSDPLERTARDVREEDPFPPFFPPRTEESTWEEEEPDDWAREEFETPEETTETEDPAVRLAPEPKTYVTKEGDSFWSIAVAEYGNGAKWKKLYEVNKNVCPDPTLMQKGMKLVIPPLEESTASAPTASAETPTTEPKIYVVKAGDSLSTIAQAKLGKSSRYEEIFELNKDKLASPHDLKVGMKLRLP